jgi:hypothetical protein
MSKNLGADILIRSGLGGLISPRIRLALAQARTAALRGHIVRAIGNLTEHTDSDSTADKVALDLTRAELLHLDQKPTEALAIFDLNIVPAARQLPEEVRMIVEQNRTDVAFGGGFPTNEANRHYAQIDRRRLAKITMRDADALLEAADAAKEGKGYESYPLYCAAMYDAYSRFDWRGMRHAAAEMCGEHIRLHNLAAAIFFAVLSEDSSAADSIAEQLRGCGQLSVLQGSVIKLREVSYLRRHVMAAAKILAKLEDAIPDSEVNYWLEHLKAHRTPTTDLWVDRWISDAAWEATTALLDGADEMHADAAVDEILKHATWKTTDVARSLLLTPLSAASRQASELKCREIIEALAPLVLARPPGADCRESIAVLYDIVGRLPALKSVARELVYHDKTKLNDLLVRFALSVDMVLKLEKPAENATSVAEGLRHQVERLGPGQVEHTGLGEIMRQSKLVPSGSIVVKVGSSIESLFTMVAYRSSIPAPSLDLVLRAILEVIKDPENLNTNRRSLFEVLSYFGDVMSATMAESCIELMTTYAADHRVPSHPLHGQAEEYSPMAAFRMGDGWPQEVRGAALVAIARTVKHHPEIAGPPFSRLLAAAMSDADASLRKDAYRAAHLAGAVAEGFSPVLVGGTRDADPVAASLALQACASHLPALGKDGLLPTLLTAIETQHQHRDPRIRYGAAVVAAELGKCKSEMSEVAMQRLVTVIDKLSSDISRRVRRAAKFKAHEY